MPMTLDRETDQAVQKDFGAPAGEQPPRTQDDAPARRNKTRIVIPLVLVLLIAAGVAYWFHTRDRITTDDAQVDGHMMPVAAKVSGNVIEVLVKDNEHVKKGQVLVRLDPRDYQARVDQASAALQLARSQAQGAAVGVPLTRATTSSATSEAVAQLQAAQADAARAEADYQRASTAEIAVAKANVDAAQANFDKAQADLERMRPLVQKQEISRQQYDTYVAAERVASSQLQAAKDRLASAQQDAATRRAAYLGSEAKVQQARAGVEQARARQQQVSVRSADVGSAKAVIEQAKANLEAAQLQLSYTTIVAPADGVVTHKVVEVGQILQPGQSLMTIVPLDDVWVTANYKETQLRNVRIGQRAEVKVDLTGTTYDGHVDSIAGATGSRMSLLPPENAAGNFLKVVQRLPVKIVLDNKDQQGVGLRPGMNADVTIFTK